MHENSRDTGEAVAFFDTGGTVIGLFPWDQLAKDVTLPDQPRPQDLSRRDARLELRFDRGSRRRAGFRGLLGASLLKPAHKTDYGGYSGYFGDPDNHPWEVVVAPGIEVGEDRRVHLPD